MQRVVLNVTMPTTNSPNHTMINAERLECMVIAIHDSVDHLLKGHHMQDASQLTTKHTSKENLVYTFFVVLW